jgi:hypothetical protein
MRRRNRWLFPPLLTGALLVLAAPAAGVDGVLEISQACVADGCFPGDGPGFPVRIANPGSYRLTSNLQLPDENTTGIDVSTDHVTIDLNGFEIAGVTICTGVGSGLSCNPTGLGDGVTSLAETNTTVRNGTIRGMGRYGVGLFALPDGQARPERAGTVEHVRVVSNGSDGIHFTSSGFLVRASWSMRNGGAGINASSNLFNEGGSIVGSVADGNGGPGIACRACLVRDNVVRMNGSQGVVASFGSAVHANVIHANEGSGLAGGGYAGNVFFNNADSTPVSQVIGGVQIGQNLCQGVLCP